MSLINICRLRCYLYPEAFSILNVIPEEHPKIDYYSPGGAHSGILRSVQIPWILIPFHPDYDSWFSELIRSEQSLRNKRRVQGLKGE